MTTARKSFALETATLVTTLVTIGIVSAALSRRQEKKSLRRRDDEGDHSLPFVSHQQEPSEMIQKSSPNIHVPYHHERLSASIIQARARSFRKLMQQRRTIRFFSKDSVDVSIMQDIIETAATSPSGAHKQPWHFCLIGNDKMKREIRTVVEHEETINYQRRMKKSWVRDVQNMVDNLHSTTQEVEKPYLTEAPWLIAVMKQPYGINNGKRDEHYYSTESVGIACGMLIAAIHNANLVTLTSTPMGAERKIKELLGRPDYEKVFLLLPVGFPAEDATVPYRNPKRKPLTKVMSIH